MFSTLRAYSGCVVLVTQDFPQLLLANRTGTYVLVVVAAAWLIAELKVNKQIHHSHFVESVPVCRDNSQSLSDEIRRNIVKWKELED